MVVAVEIVYVDPGVPFGGAGDGSTPADAYAGLQTAITAKITDLWIAQKVMEFRCINPTDIVDGVVVDFGGAGWAATGTTYPRIVVDDAYRNTDGTVNTGYRIVVTASGTYAFQHSTDYGIVDGLTIVNNGSGGNTTAVNHYTSANGGYVIRSLLSCPLSAGHRASTGILNYQNCIVRDCVYGSVVGTFQDTSWRSCTFSSCDSGMIRPGQSNGHNTDNNVIYKHTTADWTGNSTDVVNANHFWGDNNASESLPPTGFPGKPQPAVASIQITSADFQADDITPSPTSLLIDAGINLGLPTRDPGGPGEYVVDGKYFFGEVKPLSPTAVNIGAVAFVESGSVGSGLLNSKTLNRSRLV
jgi:hypothetical protein